MEVEASTFEMAYGKWIEEEHQITSELQNIIIDENVTENDDILKHYVETCFALYKKMQRYKSTLAKTDVLHLLSPTCWTPVERCFFWIGGFRPSHLLKIIMSEMEPLREQQVFGMIRLRQSTQEAEEAISQGLEAGYHSVSDIISTDVLYYASNATSCMAQMSTAISKISALENFVEKADDLRSHTFNGLYQILTNRQMAACFLIISNYFQRLRDLSSIWLNRAKEPLYINEAN